MDEKRTLVLVRDSSDYLINKLLLTDDQIRFLNWMKENDHIVSDSLFTILDDEIEPEII